MNHIVKLSVLGIFATAFYFSLNPLNSNNNTAFSQANQSDGFGTETPLESLQNQTFSQIVISTAQLDEILNTIQNVKQAANDGNMTDITIQLATLENQINIIRERANVFGNIMVE